MAWYWITWHQNSSEILGNVDASECCLCFAAFSNGDSGLWLDCDGGHLICEECAEGWQDEVMDVNDDWDEMPCPSCINWHFRWDEAGSESRQGSGSAADPIVLAQEAGSAVDPIVID